MTQNKEFLLSIKREEKRRAEKEQDRKRFSEEFIKKITKENAAKR